MSAARPLRCMLSGRLAATATTAKPTTTTLPPSCRAAPLHTSARLQARRPRFKSIRAEEMGLTTPETIEEFSQEHFKPYTPEELDALRRFYTPEQMQVLEAGEAAINPRDLTLQGRLRKDKYRLPYLDDFARTFPVIDKKSRREPPPEQDVRWLETPDMVDQMERSIMDMTRAKAAKQKPDVEWAEMSDDELREALDEHEIDVEPDGMDERRFWEERKMIEGSGRLGNEAVAPGVGKDIPGVAGQNKQPIDPEDMGLDDEGIYQDLKRHTGMSVRQIKDITVKILVTRYVHNQTRLGKIRSTWILAIAGNGNGRLGIGEAKSTEAGVANVKARLDAIKNMKPIPRYEYRTIFGSVQGKVGATVVRLDARPPGFGLRASHRLFEMFRAVGLQDIAARMPRSRNPMNSVKACYEALLSQKDPNEIAIGRGMKMVDVRKVYYGNNVL